MPEAGLDERVARLEGRVEGFDDRFDGLERRLDGLEQRIGALDAKVDRFREELRGDLGGRMATLEAGVARRFESLDHKVSRHFIWTIGVQVTVLLAVVMALTGR